MQITDNQSMFASFCPYNDSWISPVNGRRPNERHEEIVLSLVSGRPRVPRPAGRRIHSPNRPVIKPSIMVASFTRWLTKHCSTLNWPRFISLPILLPPPFLVLYVFPTCFLEGWKVSGYSHSYFIVINSASLNLCSTMVANRKNEMLGDMLTW